MKHKLLLALGAILVLLSACEKDDSFSSTKQLLQFSIRADLNPGAISETVEGVIQEHVISLPLDKYDNLNALVATFQFNGKRVTMGGKEQVSGVTSNNYSQSLSLVVEAEDGSEIPYTIKMVLKDTDVFSGFRFSKNRNPALSTDAACVISANKVLSAATFPVTKLIPEFTTHAVEVTVDGVKQTSGVTENDFRTPQTYRFTMRNGESYEYIVALDFLYNAVPQFAITLEDPSITEIPDKENYLTATLTVDGKGVYADYTGKTEIRGRGNSTWGYPKKPYRLKLDKKSEICGLGKAKNFVLLANHIDPTLMLNSVAFKIGRLLDLPFTNHAIPVDVVLNGKYKGSYLLTEQVEVKENRVDLDEANSIMWELDSYFDEDWQFKSTAFNLPVMVKDPDMKSQTQFDDWKNDFNEFATQFAKEPLEGNSYVDKIDIESVVKYLIVFNLTHNMEINHPKSIFMHKEGQGKYVMGPIWDFDWAYDYEKTYKHFGNYNRSLFSNAMNGTGTAFFQRFLRDSRVKALYKQHWQSFKANQLEALLHYVDSYATVLKPSVTKNSELWENTRSFETKVAELKKWLKNRANYIDQEVNQL